VRNENDGRNALYVSTRSASRRALNAALGNHAFRKGAKGLPVSTAERTIQGRIDTAAAAENTAAEITLARPETGNDSRTKNANATTATHPNVGLIA